MSTGNFRVLFTAVFLFLLAAPPDQGFSQIAPQKREAQRASDMKPSAVMVQQGKADLVVESFNLLPLNPTTGDSLLFIAIVKNIGGGPSSPCKLILRIGGESSPPVFEIPGLARGARHTVQRSARLAVAQGYSAEARVDIANSVAELNEANNAKSLSFAVAPSSPDLIVESLTAAPSNPSTGESILFVAVVSNIGRGPAGPSKLSLRVGGESAPPRFDVPALPPGGRHTIQRSIALDIAQSYSAEAKADAENAVVESDEANNARSVAFKVTQSSPDLVVDQFALLPSDPSVTDETLFIAIVKNIGTAAAPPSQLVLRVGGESAPPRFPVPALAPGERHIVQRNVKLTVSQGYSAEARADAENAVAETSESNNSKTLSFTVR